MSDLPVTFGNIAIRILKVLLSYHSSTIVVAFDKYKSPSIKDNEHARRQACDQRMYSITGASQKRGKDFATELRNITFKESLIKFLLKYWDSDDMAPFFDSKTLYVNYDECYKFEVHDGKVRKTVVQALSCPAHEEADTKIVYHAAQIDHSESDLDKDDYNVLIRCSDTDIVVIMLGNMEHVKRPMQIWMELGTGNAHRFINVTKLYNLLGPAVCSALPALHALTGCDYNPAFYRKGKKKPFELLEASLEYQQALTRLGDANNDSTTEDFEVFERFVCQMYGRKSLNDVNDCRDAIFASSYKCKKADDTFKIKTKNFDASALPPCKSELENQLRRTAYISSIWRNAHLQHPTHLEPTDCGWHEVDGKYQINWFEGEQLPKFVNEVVIQPENAGMQI